MTKIDADSYSNMDTPTVFEESSTVCKKDSAEGSTSEAVMRIISISAFKWISTTYIYLCNRRQTEASVKGDKYNLRGQMDSSDPNDIVRLYQRSQCGR